MCQKERKERRKHHQGENHPEQLEEIANHHASLTSSVLQERKGRRHASFTPARRIKLPVNDKPAQPAQHGDMKIDPAKAKATSTTQDPPTWLGSQTRITGREREERWWWGSRVEPEVRINQTNQRRQSAGLLSLSLSVSPPTPTPRHSAARARARAGSRLAADDGLTGHRYVRVIVDRNLIWFTFARRMRRGIQQREETAVKLGVSVPVPVTADWTACTRSDFAFIWAFPFPSCATMPFTV